MTTEVSFDHDFDLNPILSDKKIYPEDLALLKAINRYIIIDLCPHKSAKLNSDFEMQIDTHENYLFTVTFKYPVEISNNLGVSSFESYIHFTGIDEVVKPRKVIFMPGMIDHLKPLNQALVYKMTNGDLIIFNLNDRSYLDSNVIGKLRVEKDIFDTNLKNHQENNADLPVEYEIHMKERFFSEAEWNALKLTGNEKFWFSIFFVNILLLIYFLTIGYEQLSIFKSFVIILLTLTALLIGYINKRLIKYTPFPIIKTHQALYLLYNHLNDLIGLMGRNEEKITIPPHWKESLIDNITKNGVNRKRIEYAEHNKMIVKFGDELNLEQEGAKKFIKLWRYHIFMLIFTVITCLFLWSKTPIFDNVYLQYQKHFDQVEAINLIDWQNDNLKSNISNQPNVLEQVQKLSNQIIFFDGLIACRVESKETFSIKNICAYKQLLTQDNNNIDILSRYTKFNDYLANYKLPLTPDDFAFDFVDSIRIPKDPKEHPLILNKYPLYSNTMIERIKELKSGREVVKITYLLQNRKLIEYVEKICESTSEEACLRLKALFLNGLLFNYQIDNFNWETLKEKIITENQLSGANFTFFYDSPDIFFNKFAAIQSDIFNEYLRLVNGNNRANFWIDSSEGEKFTLRDISFANDNNRLVKPEPLTGYFKIVDLTVKDNNVYLNMQSVNYNLLTSQIIIAIFIILLLGFLISYHTIKFLLCLRFPKTSSITLNKNNQNSTLKNDSDQSITLKEKTTLTKNRGLDLQGIKRK